jgi:hypothetical protein
MTDLPNAFFDHSKLLFIISRSRFQISVGTRIPNFRQSRQKSLLTTPLPISYWWKFDITKHLLLAQLAKRLDRAGVSKLQRMRCISYTQDWSRSYLWVIARLNILLRFPSALLASTGSLHEVSGNTLLPANQFKGYAGLITGGRLRRLLSSRTQFVPYTPSLKPNSEVEWLTLLLCIREVPGSNLGPETGYPLWFSSVPPGECHDSSWKLNCDGLLSNPFQFNVHLSPYHWTIFSLIII